MVPSLFTTLIQMCFVGKKSIAKSYRDYKATDSMSTIPESLKNMQKNPDIVNDNQVE